MLGEYRVSGPDCKKLVSSASASAYEEGKPRLMKFRQFMLSITPYYMGPARRAVTSWKARTCWDLFLRRCMQFYPVGGLGWTVTLYGMSYTPQLLSEQLLVPYLSLHSKWHLES
ncbi:unnamed protein product [Staurois parvus]|uniref:Uncharacterized protein n=1 Tax=Staurois parvus TaxID=386267 RepID=A0ABN9DTY8_9NEOB|nr:unnamed protein product [Staurois parvus]